MLSKEKSIYFSCGEVAEAENISYGIYEVPEARIEFIGKIGDVSTLAFSIEGYQHADYSILGYVFTLKGIITANDIAIAFLADYSMEDVIFCYSVKDYVILFKWGFRLFYNYHIPMRFEERAHTCAACYCGIGAVERKLFFGGTVLRHSVRSGHSIIPAEVSFSQKASISRSAISLSTS